MRADQQAAVAALSRLALTGAETQAVMDKAVDLVARTLQVEFAKVLELQPDGHLLFLRAGVGWKEGRVGRATVPAELGSQAGYTLGVRRAVIVEDLRTETRFHGPELLLEHQVTSGMSVVIEGKERPFGVLGVHTVQRRSFLKDEVRFLEVVANVLAAAIERKATDEALRAERDLLQALLDNIPDTIYFKDTHSRFTRINSAQVKALGIQDAHQALGKTDADFFNSEHAREALADEQHVFSSGQPLIDKREWLRLGSGGWRWLSATKVPMRDSAGKILGLVGVSRDITERVEAEQRLHEQALLLDAATDAIVVCKVGGLIVFWNQGAARLYGWSAGEALGRSVGELLFKESPEVFAETERILSEQSAWHGELSETTQAGTIVMVQSAWTLIRDGAGRPKSVLMINTDITEKKRLETQFFRTQRLECLGVLAGGVAHDLNNALAPVSMAVDLLTPLLPSEEGRQLLRMIADGTERASQMVRQILAFSRGLGGKRMNLQVGHLIRDLKRIALDTFPKTIAIQVQAPRELWGVSGDPTQLHQVLVNLCVNARDAMPGGGRLTIGAENVELDGQYVAMDPEASVGPYVAVSVTDTGVGMSREVLDHLFEPFFSTKEVGKGTGLGLSTSLGIVKNHGGFIKVTSTSGRGSVFKVFLPALRHPAAEVAQEATGEPPRGRGELILVVDDEEAVRTICRLSLETHGSSGYSSGTGWRTRINPRAAFARFCSRRWSDSWPTNGTKLARSNAAGASRAFHFSSIKNKIACSEHGTHLPSMSPAVGTQRAARTVSC